jgi:hypothetical protein
MRIQLFFAATVASLVVSACDGGDTPPLDPDGPAAGVDARVDAAPDGPAPIAMSFFITSKEGPAGGDFRRAGMNDTDGLAGADEFCRSLAAAVDPAQGTKTWRAYLSTTTVNAKDRIGTGPWYNQKLVKVADTVADLLDPALPTAGGKNLIAEATGLDEKGGVVPLNRHDIITGTLATGLAAPVHCNNWTDNGTATAMTGHYNRAGGGSSPNSWSSAHNTNGCTLQSFNGSGGRGSIYCFRVN